MKTRSLVAASLGATALLASFVPAADAGQTVASERYGGAASARALRVDIAGQSVTLGAGLAGSELDAVTPAVDATASGIGSGLHDESTAVAGAGESHEGCAVPDVAVGPYTLDADVVCGTATVAGTGTAVDATGAGRLAGLRIGGEGLIAGLFDTTVLEPILGDTIATVEDAREAVRQQIADVDPDVADAVAELESGIEELLGEHTADLVIPSVADDETVQGLLSQLEADLVEVVSGEGTGDVVADDSALTARATDHGAEIRILPGLLDGRPVATVTVSESVAEVVYHRGDTSTEGGASTVTVRIDSPLLDAPIEVAEGRSVEIFCDPVATGVDEADGGLRSADLSPLCSRIHVGSPVHREVDGRLQVETALVTLDLLTGLDRLVPSAPAAPGAPALPEAPALPVAPGAPGLPAVSLPQPVTDLMADLGIDEGVATAAGGPSSGIRLEVAGAVAQAGGAKVLDEVFVAPSPSDQPFEGPLPRTGLPGLPYAATGLLGLGAGLRALVSRWSA